MHPNEKQIKSILKNFAHHAGAHNHEVCSIKFRYRDEKSNEIHLSLSNNNIIEILGAKNYLINNYAKFSYSGVPVEIHPHENGAELLTSIASVATIFSLLISIYQISSQCRNAPEDKTIISIETRKIEADGTLVSKNVLIKRDGKPLTRNELGVVKKALED